jgi:predicted dehydrogenase
MTARTRWGVLATGGIATKFVEDLKLLPQAELTAVASRRLETAQEFAKEHGFARAYGSWLELATDPDVDVVYVATPHVAHHEAAKLCLEAGRAVLCEKPFTLAAATTQDLVDTAGERGLFLMEAMWMRTNPTIRRIVELVGDGAIGEVTAVTADFGFPAPPDPAHRLNNKALGGGSLLDLGVYPITFAQLFLGDPDRISAVATLDATGVDLTTAALLAHPGGGVAYLASSIVGDHRNAATVTGTRGRIELPRGFHHPTSFRLCRGEEAETVQVPLRGNGLGYEAEEVMRCLDAGLTESPLVPLAASLGVMRTMDTIREQIGLSYSQTGSTSP